MYLKDHFDCHSTICFLMFSGVLKSDNATTMEHSPVRILKQAVKNCNDNLVYNSRVLFVSFLQACDQYSILGYKLIILFNHNKFVCTMYYVMGTSLMSSSFV